MDSALLDRFSTTVQSIHAAALQPEGWPQALAHIAALHNAPKALAFTPLTQPDDGGFVLAHAIAQSFLQEWAERYLPHDVWTTQARDRDLLHDGRVLLGEDLVPDAQLVQSIFYREFLARQGIRRLCSGVVFSGRMAGLPSTTCSVFRGSDGAPFTEADRHLHALVVRHLSLALGAALRLRDAEFRLATSLQALDRLHGAVLLLGQRGNVLFANRNALALLTQAQGLALRTGNPATDALGWLQAGSACAQNALDAELRAALASNPLQATHFAHGLALQRPSPKGDLVLHAVPLGEQGSALWSRLLQPGALVFITDPQAVPVLDPALLHRLYGISTAECRVAQQLLHGQTLQQAACHLHLGSNTVKTHVQQLFEKTRTHRQQQLIGLLLALASQH